MSVPLVSRMVGSVAKGYSIGGFVSYEAVITVAGAGFKEVWLIRFLAVDLWRSP